LDLNEAEMEEYEEVVNELAQQLEEMTRIKDELSNHIIMLHNEKDEFIRVQTEHWSEEKTDLMRNIQGLQEAVAESNNLFAECSLDSNSFNSRKDFLADLRAKALQAEAMRVQASELSKVSSTYIRIYIYIYRYVYI
jgi:cell division septum initiation protein DivIVA